MFGNPLRATWLANGFRIGIPVFVTLKPMVVPVQPVSPRHPDIQLEPPTAQKRINSLPWELHRGASDTPFPSNS